MMKLDWRPRGGVKSIQVLEVATGKLVVGNDLDLALALLLDNDVVAEVVGAALDLDALLEELLEGGDVEDLVGGGLGSVDDELFATVSKPIGPNHSFPGGGGVSSFQLTFLVVLADLPDFFCRDENCT